jgi:hypothetical protein
MSALDFTDYEGAELIPNGTDCILQVKIKFGDASDSVLTYSKNRDAEVLKVMFTVVDGPQARRAFWQNLLVKGTTDGQKTMADKNNALLKAILDSARNLDPTDKSPAARQARTVQYRDFNDMRFQGVIGVQPQRTDKDTGQTYQAQNFIDKVITRDLKEWRGPIEQMAPFNDPLPFDTGVAQPDGAAVAGTAATPAPITKPSWAS